MHNHTNPLRTNSIVHGASETKINPLVNAILKEKKNQQKIKSHTALKIEKYSRFIQSNLHTKYVRTLRTFSTDFVWSNELNNNLSFLKTEIA